MWSKSLIRINCSSATRAKAGYGAAIFDFLFEDVTNVAAPEGTFQIWRELPSTQGSMAVGRSGREVGLDVLIKEALANEVEFLSEQLRETEIENYKLRDLFYNSAAKVGHMSAFIANSSLAREYMFVEIPPVDFVSVKIGCVIEQRILRVPSGASKIALFSPLSSKGVTLKCRLIDTLSGRIYFDGPVTIRAEEWFSIDFDRPVSDAQNSLLLTITVDSRKGGELETASLAFSSKYRPEMGSIVDGASLLAPLAYRVYCGPSIGTTNVTSANWFPGRHGSHISVADAAKNLVVLQSNVVKRLSARVGEDGLLLEVGDIKEPLTIVFRDTVVKAALSGAIGRLSGLIIESTISANSVPDFNCRSQILIRSSRTGRIIDEPSAVYTAMNGWRLPMLSPITSVEEFDVVLRIVPSTEAKNGQVVIHSIRGVSFS